MLFFKKKDPITEAIQKEYVGLEIKKLGTNELDLLIAENKNHPITTIAIGLYYKNNFPTLVRGYLTAYDNLYRLGFDEDSLLIIKEFMAYTPYHPLTISRLVKRYVTCKDYQSALDLLLNIPDSDLISLNANSSIKAAALELAVITGNSDLITIFDLDNIEKIINRTQELASNKLPNHSLRLEKLKDLISNKNFSAAENFCWALYNAGENSHEFFSIACNPLPSELDISSRVIFFRIQAARVHPDVIFSINAAKSFLYMGEISQARNVTRASIYKKIVNAELLHIHIRASQLLGEEYSALLETPEALSRSFQQVANFSLIRQLNKSILTNNNDEEATLRPLIGQRKIKNYDILSSKPTRAPLHKEKTIRVAVCISGQLRGLEKNAKNIIKNICSQDNTDIFVDTWSTRQLTFPRYTRVQRFIGDHLWSLLPAELRMPDGFKEALPKTTRKLTTPITREVDEKYIKSHFENCQYRIENDDTFEETILNTAPKLKHRGNFNQAKMFYKIKRSHELMESFSEKHEIGYDVVIRTRPDLDIVIPCLDHYIECAHKNPNTIYVSYVTAVGYGDQFAIGSMKAMQIYASTWDKILAAKQFSYSDYFDIQVEKFAGEALLANHLLISGITVFNIKTERAFFTTSLAINETDIETELMEDINNSKLSNTIEPFIKKYLEIKSAQGEFN